MDLCQLRIPLTEIIQNRERIYNEYTDLNISQITNAAMDYDVMIGWVSLNYDLARTCSFDYRSFLSPIEKWTWK
jgi:hypothetical protein